MEKDIVFQILFVEAIVILTVLIVFFLLIVRKNVRIQKKFDKYTISPLKANTISFFDKIFNFFNSLVFENEKIFRKSVFLQKYAKRFEKHLTFEELKTKDGMYLISVKFIISYLVTILYVISMCIQQKSITFSSLILSFVIGFFILDIYLYFLYKKRRKDVEEDLLKAIIIMNNAFKSGRSTLQAVEIVKNDLDGAIADEFKKIYLDISYGLSLETVFDRFYERIKLEEARYLSTSLTLLNRTGGNIVKVFESIEKEFYNRKKLNNELRSMTSSSNFVFKVLLFIPFVVSFLILILNKEYFNPLFTTNIGKIVLLLIVFIYILYALIVKKVMKV